MDTNSEPGKEDCRESSVGDLAASTTGRSGHLTSFDGVTDLVQGRASWPPQTWYIIGNEACERFSFYGMKAILVIFMIDSLSFSPSGAEMAYHLFVSACYLLPLLGAWLADAVLGRYWTILSLSTFYVLGHGVLALFENRPGLGVGLALIALGAGGIKPCVSALVGDQFTEANKHLLPDVYAAFYFSINMGSVTSILLIPEISKTSMFWAFALPGIFMLLALLIFWAGSKKYITVPPRGSSSEHAGFLRVTTYAMKGWIKREKGKGFWDGAREHFLHEDVEAAAAICGLLKVFSSVAMFWSLFDQHGSTWVIQAREMDLHIFGWEMHPAQMQALNPILVLLLIPLFNTVLYPLLQRRGVRLTPLRKMGAGMLLAGLSFVIIACVQAVLDMGAKVSVLWQTPAYVVLTSAEILVSVTGLEFAYTQAPPHARSTIMSLWMLTTFAGNLLDAGIASINIFQGGPLFFLFFAVLMLVVAMLFIFTAIHYKVQGGEDPLKRKHSDIGLEDAGLLLERVS